MNHVAQNGLRIRPFEAHSHFPSIANPPILQIPQENSKNLHFPKKSQNPKIRESAGVGSNGRSPLNSRAYEIAPDDSLPALLEPPLWKLLSESLQAHQALSRENLGTGAAQQHELDIPSTTEHWHPRFSVFSEFSEIRFPKIRISGNPKIRILRFPDFRICENPSFRKSENLRK